MLNKLINLALAHRLIVLSAAVLLTVLGVREVLRLPVEVLPDLTKPTVTLLTEAPGLAPEEVETQVTRPLESALMGVNGVSRIRSTSDVALSLVYVEFDWDTDIYQARQFVQERMQSASENLPEDVTPFMTPAASLMGEIMLVGISAPEGNISPRELRSYADWTVRRRLQSIPGIAEVLSMGGGVKQIHILPNPNKMLSLGVSYEELRHAAREAADTSNGGFLESGAKEVMVRILAMTTNLEEISKTVVRHDADRAITISDVASVEWGTEPMRGDAAVNGKPGVIMSITKSPGFDTLALTADVEAALEELKKTQPEGMHIEPLFRQSSFINKAIDNLKQAIAEGAIMVVIVLIIFLLNARTTLITLTAIPLSFAITAITFGFFGISVNSMTLGGIAVAMGIVVDDAIVDVENVFRRLRENAERAEPRPRLQVIADASGEVRNSILYATLFIILVFVPLLALTGVEGRLFTPIAIATMVSMAGSFVVSLTVIPVLCSVLLNPKPGKEHKDGFLVRAMKWLLRKTFLKIALNAPVVTIAVALIILAGTALIVPQMHKNFLPSFKEETIVVATTAAPGTSLAKTTEIALVADQLLMEIPGIKSVGHRVGRAERGDHIVPVSTVEFDIELDKEGPPRQQILDEIKEKMKGLPGTFSSITGPLADRISHMLSGVPAKIAIKVSGPDLNELRRIGSDIQKVATQIPGLEEAKLEQQAPIPQLRIEPDRDRAKAYGLTPADISEQLSALLGGEVATELYEGQRTIDLVVKLPEEWRSSPEKLNNLYLDTQGGARIPLHLVANIRKSSGPNMIMRENGQRRFVVSINPTSDNLVELVEELKKRVDTDVRLPEGYFLNFEGEYVAQQEASRTILISSIVVLVIISLLLFSYFGNANFVIQVILNIPLALIGGVLLTWQMNNNISIATLVGFIAVTGISARNSIMLISHYLHLMKHEGESFTREMISRGTQERLVPVLMTALSAGLALIPLVIATNEPGKEILNPVAIVIAGGLISSTLLDFVVTPAIFYLFGRKAAEKAVQNDTPALMSN